LNLVDGGNVDSGKTIKFVSVDADAEVKDTNVACMDINDEESGSPIMITVSGLFIVL
uniref:Uncharacterized protein n=1 Tax=Amphimedon queenslandica TaxID=400682 RepID=A0A1X7UYU0_AMPQE